MAQLDYRRLSRYLDLALQLAPEAREHDVKGLFEKLIQSCNEELIKVKDEKDKLKNQLDHIRLELATTKIELDQARGERDQLQNQLGRLKGQADRLKKRLLMFGFPIVMLITILIVIISFILWSKLIPPETKPPLVTSGVTLTSFPCSDMVINGLELRSATESFTILPGDVFTTTTSAFSLHPQTEPESRTVACEFEWSVFYDSEVVTFIDTEFTSDRQELVNGREVLLLEKSKCVLLLSVAPSGEFGKGVGNHKSFKIVLSDCPYPK